LSSAKKGSGGAGGNVGGGTGGSQNNGSSPTQANDNHPNSSSNNGRSTPTVRPQLPPPSLLEYEALALRVAPPEISVDNVSRAAATVITIDSANRPGTLVSVVEFLTARGLDVRRARISSDGGWFYDGE
jgi:UTP:GlnB (protein PII) uridylyltransferase